MPKLSIDHREVEVPQGATILDAARKLDIDVPTLCHLDGHPANTSCLVCMVKIRQSGKLVPACGAPAEDGMEVESETDEVHAVRRQALELLLSDHLGDCLAPCWFGCPANMDIPLMLRQIARRDFAGAIETVKRDIALPAVLGRICPAPCEKTCRRTQADGAVAICLLKRLVADVDLAASQPYVPECAPASGKRVAIVGAGPTGLAAAYYLARRGHACVLFDENPTPGGRLLRETSEEELPREVLQAEAETILRLGIELRAGTRVANDPSPADVQREFDAVLLALGAQAPEQAEAWGVKTQRRGIGIDGATYATGVDGLFAAGAAVRGKCMVIRSAADGKEAAAAIDQYLRGEPVTGIPRPLNVRMGRLQADEIDVFLAAANRAGRREPSGGTQAGFAADEGAEQAERCLRCDCRALADCRLRHYAAVYQADPKRHGSPQRHFVQDWTHEKVVYEPGKCIACGLCIAITEAAGEPVGLAFRGRGFDVRVAVPMTGTLSDALTKTAAECVAACPTAALAWK
ncbi:MAG: FAD-dependent oxidoreductase [Thermoguttaceae bacterium]|jgi:ferredoxin|nr:FAD-dependent oxidoreductase [Thermoguttaceae bacterium]